MKKLILFLPVMAMLLITLSGCVYEADVASKNLSTAADQFEINRRIVFYNGITGEYMLSIEGFCSLGNNDTDRQRTVVCKIGNEYKKHFLGLSDNVTYFAEQIDSKNVSKDHYKIIFKPSIIIPDVDIK